jgi:hypothetical protein
VARRTRWLRDARHEPAAAYPTQTNPFGAPQLFAAPATTSLADPQQSAHITLGMRIGGA